jgi:hypothetical protein
MAITKGIVQGDNYTFSAANQTITFSSDYLGMSLSDITYITNIKSGVATVIYDPFDVAKGGVLNGLTLTLAYNTTLMSDSDPLQIIVGFTPSTATPQNVNVAPNSQLDAQTELLGSISKNIDMLAKAQDQVERMPINIRDENPAKRDVNNAQVPSDCITFTKTLRAFTDVLLIETTGYNSIEVVFNGDAALSSATISPVSSVDGVNWLLSPYVSNNASTIVSIANIGVSPSTSIRALFPVIGKFIRFTLIGISGGGAVTIVANLRQTPLLTGPFTQIPVNANISTINGNTAQGFTTSPTNPTSPTGASGSLNFTGSVLGTTNPPNAFSTLQSTLPFPVSIGGREQPYIGALSGIFRHITVDGGGRYILGGDTPDTETRFQSKRADGSISGIPPRGVGAKTNTMFGSQALLIQDVSQSEGDTTTTLLQQILVELKMLNNQINELPFVINQGVKMQNEVQDYRQEEYNNHVNNQ